MVIRSPCPIKMNAHHSQTFMKIGSQSLLSTEKAQALQKISNAQELLYHRLANFMGKAIWIGLIFGCYTMALAQQKVKDGSISGNNLPNKDALLELESNNKGLLHARVALRLTTDAFPLTAHVAGMMVYNTTTTNDVVPGIYYNDGSKWVFVKSSNAILVEDQWGKTGAPGIPGTVGGHRFSGQKGRVVSPVFVDSGFL